MITIAEVIEQCAKECEEMGRAYAVRTLKQRYEGCIVAHGTPFMFRDWAKDVHVCFYRAKEPTK